MFGFFCCAVEDPTPLEEVNASEVFIASTFIASTGSEVVDGESVSTGIPDDDRQAPETDTAPKAAEPEATPAPKPALASEPAPIQQPSLSPESAPELPKDCIEWEVTVTKSPGKTMLGMNLDCHSSWTPCVKELQGGSLIVDWNEAHPDKRVSIGDAIITVNGATDTPSKILRLKEDSCLTMRFRRVSAFTVPINKGTEGIGISFSGPGTGPAKVHCVKEGKAVATYNRDAEPGRVMVPGDIVMSVNGEAGSKDQVVNAIAQASGLVELQVRHPS